MKPILRITLILLATLLPTIAAAQQSSTETVTIQLNGNTPAGTSVIGTIVLQRTCGSTVSSTATFNGMVNGRQAQFAGTVRENWLGNGKEEIEVLSTNLSGLVLGSSPLRKIMLAQNGANMIAVDGVPVAINGTLEPPCSGRTSYIVTNVGQGSFSILRLPNAGSNQILDDAQRLMLQPYGIVGLLIGAGVLLILVSRLLYDRPQRRAGTGTAGER